MLSGDSVQHLTNTLLSVPKSLSPLLKHSEHVVQFARQLIVYQQYKTLKCPPFFNEECTPSIDKAIEPFNVALNQWLSNKEQSSVLFAQAFENTELKDLLLILGQRCTPASITDEQAVPPPKQQLIDAFNAAYRHTLTVGARAWSKHVNRSEEVFWGEVKGNDEEKNKTAAGILVQILKNATWWNVFEHYKHHLVYEVRLPSGHGARWKLNDKTFIGFLEPFLEEA